MKFNNTLGTSEFFFKDFVDVNHIFGNVIKPKKFIIIKYN